MDASQGKRDRPYILYSECPGPDLYREKKVETSISSPGGCKDAGALGSGHTFCMLQGKRDSSGTQGVKKCRKNEGFSSRMVAFDRDIDTRLFSEWCPKGCRASKCTDHQDKKGNQWRFGIKALWCKYSNETYHIVIDEDYGYIVRAMTNAIQPFHLIIIALAGLTDSNRRSSTISSTISSNRTVCSRISSKDGG